MWLIVIIITVCIIAVCMLLISVANANKKESEKVKEEFIRANIFAEQYNNSWETFEKAYQAAKNKANTVNDVSVLMKLANINRSFEETAANVKGRLETLLTTTSASAKMQQENLLVDGLLNDMETFIELVQQLRYECKQEYSTNSHEAPKISTNNSSGYFAGCTTKDDAAKRWRALCKIYHPDSGSGDEETFKIIRKEYDRFEEKQ